MEQPGGKAMEALNWCEIGFCASAVGKLEDAGSLFERALNSSSTAIHLYRPQAHVGAGLVALAENRVDEAAEHAQSARSLASEKGMRYLAPQISELEARVEVANGNLEAARPHLEDAEQRAGELGFLPLLARRRHRAPDRRAGDRGERGVAHHPTLHEPGESGQDHDT